MAFVTKSDVRSAARRAQERRLYKSAAQILDEAAAVRPDTFDVFLSHAIVDAEIVLGAMRILEEAGLKVYVDWIVDTQLERGSVTPETARLLRDRMNQCKSLFYVYTTGATKSRWMPWELGYFDGHNGNIAVFPVLDNTSQSFKGDEFVGLYPYVDITNLGSTNTNVWIHRDSSTYKPFTDWRVSADKLRPSNPRQ